jgi:solute carrier family 15 oligopeptide transporter 1
VNELLIYIFAIIGAIVADSWLGTYKTIAIGNLFFIFGSTLLTIANMNLIDFIPIQFTSFIGLFAVMLGIGVIKPSQTVLGGNQFKLPEQAKELDEYFSVQYIVMKIGTVLGMVVIPILRKDVKCFGENDCYSLALWIVTILIICAQFSLWKGKPHYIEKPLSGNMLVKVVGCIRVRNFISFKFQKKKLLNFNSVCRMEENNLQELQIFALAGRFIGKV